MKPGGKKKRNRVISFWSRSRPIGIDSARWVDEMTSALSFEKIYDPVFPEIVYIPRQDGQLYALLPGSKIIALILKTFAFGIHLQIVDQYPYRFTVFLIVVWWNFARTSTTITTRRKSLSTFLNCFYRMLITIKGMLLYRQHNNTCHRRKQITAYCNCFLFVYEA